MNSAAKLLAVVLVLAIAAAAYFAFSGEPETPFTDPDPSKDQLSAEAPVDDNAASMTAETGTTNEDAVRTDAANEPQRDPESYAQGIRGRVLDPFNAPVRNADVYLMPGAGLDLFRMMRMQQMGVQLPPIATTKTDQNGRFSIGVGTPDPNKELELRVPHDEFVEHTVGHLRVNPGEWVTQEIKLKKGVVMQGRVTIAGSGGVAVPGAIVSVESNGAIPSISPTPGRENGIQVETDANGFYRLRNVPQTVVNVSAVAEGFARSVKPNTSINADSENRVDFELERGLEIEGVVVNAEGTPVSGARIEALSISTKTPAQGQTRSGSDGRFAILGLLDGPYLLKAAAQGYVATERKPIQAGDREVQLVIERQGKARVRVFDKNNRLASSFRVTVKRYFEGQEHFGNTDIPTRQGRHGGEGYFEIGGLDPGDYVFQIQANAHAMAFSDHFRVAIGEEPPLVEVHLNEGGVLAGLVLGNDGQPLAGATVSTLPDEWQDNPLMIMLGGMIPVKVTRTSVSTDSKGRYRIPLLNPGVYQLKFVHPEHYDISKRGNEVIVGQTVEVPAIRMRTGTVVHGLARVDGKPSGQVKVSISSIPEPIEPGSGNTGMPEAFSAECFSNEKGEFTFGRRVPPGRYHVMAGRQGAQHVLTQIAEFAMTKREITINGQPKYFVEFQINSNGN